MTMQPALAFLLFLAGLTGLLECLNWRDRRRARALQLAAEINAEVSRQLKGESLVVIEVLPASPWRSGRVVLTAPRNEFLREVLSTPILSSIPANYELLVKAA